jgi:TIR domain
VRFLLRARAHRVGSTVEGWVRIFCGPLIIAETTVRFDVVGDAETLPGLRPEPITSYRRIFPCFSPRDRELVANVAAVAEALGDRYTAHIIEGRSEGAPDDWMLPLIDEADVFQLFWSSHSMRSATCRRQWEAALATQRSGFIRPLYWEHPFPREADVPPPALETLRFVRLPTPATASQQLWDGTPSAREPASTEPDPRQGDRAPRRAARHWLSSGGLAAVVGLVAAVVAGATATMDENADVPDINPGPSGGNSTPMVVAVSAIAFAVAFVLTLVVIRAVRRRHD